MLIIVEYIKTHCSLVTCRFLSKDISKKEALWMLLCKGVYCCTLGQFA